MSEKEKAQKQSSTSKEKQPDFKTLQEAAKAIGKATAEAASEPADALQKIYIGPNLPMLTTYTVIDGGYPAHVENAIKDCPSLKRMFVPIDELVESQQRVQKKGTIEHRRYTEVLEFSNLNRKQGEQ